MEYFQNFQNFQNHTARPAAWLTTYCPAGRRLTVGWTTGGQMGSQPVRLLAGPDEFENFENFENQWNNDRASCLIIHNLPLQLLPNHLLIDHCVHHSIPHYHI